MRCVVTGLVGDDRPHRNILRFENRYVTCLVQSEELRSRSASPSLGSCEIDKERTRDRPMSVEPTSTSWRRMVCAHLGECSGRDVGRFERTKGPTESRIDAITIL